MNLFSLGSTAPFVAMALILVVFIFFVLDRCPPEATAFCGAALALLLGLVSTETVLAAVANPAPATIGAMFVLSAALVRTGALDLAVARMSRLAQQSPTLAVVIFFVTAALTSAVINNTPVVMVLIPVALGLARQVGTTSSRLLLPLSYMVILGGTVSMIGTSTNLLVDGVAQKIGLAPFGLFEIAPLGIALALSGGLFLALAGRFLLPDRGPTVADLPQRGRSWLAELFLPAGSQMVGRPVSELETKVGSGGRVVDVIRGDESLRTELKALRFEAGDRVVLRTRDVELMGFRDGIASWLAIPGVEPGRARQTQVTELLVGRRSQAVGHTLSDMHLRRSFGVYPIAIHRDGEHIRRPNETRLSAGDLLLVDGAPSDISRMADEIRLTVLNPNTVRAFRRAHAPIAIGVLALVVGLAAMNFAPILPLALLGMAVVFATGCLDIREGVEAMDGGLLLMIISMIVLGSALEGTGAMTLLVEWLAPLLSDASPLVALALIYILTSILTELVTNNAVAVLMTPIAAGVATQLGLDPRGFVVAVMFGASASFATPIGYQTNTLVFNAGGYRFSDFLRIGIPMNILAGVVTVLLVPILWPLN
ncbi:TrkA-C domain-containing protein [Poseidonocella pacifica]|uniref:TrkA-C domain-containing protein n=1 Tax=Poseidonocella pacifica TaxID=871651 RepID=A0A1I0X8T9_9RHOB|nr:SLC13 family permease [Poseidonocella pacifica]SFA96846.1 TrkA-C domain-containing protein [Poseidonocella pacifica]